MGAAVAIRLGTVGAADVRADFSSIADSGDANAKRLAASYERASDDIGKAIQRQADAAAKISAIMPSNRQFAIDTSVGTGYDSSQNAGAKQYAALLADQERQAERVRAAIDPMYTAQKRYDAEIATASQLLRTGAISEAEHAAAIGLSGKALQEAKNALEGHTGALGLNRQQTIIAQSALLRFTDAVISGRNPLTAFALEAHKGVEVLSSDDGGMAGGLSKVRGLLSSTAVEVGLLAAVVAIGAAAWVSYEDAMAKLDAISQGAGAVIGVTGAALEANAEAASRSSTETVGAARDIETSYVKMGGIGSDVLEGLTAITADFAAATGVDTAQAVQQLGKDFQDPVKGAEELAARYGDLSQAQIDEIKHMADAGDVYGAQAKLLSDLATSVHGAAEEVHGLGLAWLWTKQQASEAWNQLGKQGSDIFFDVTGIPIPGTFEGKGPPPAHAKPDAQANAYAEQAEDASEQYTGRNQLQALQQKQAMLRRALNDPGAVANLQQAGALDQTREQLEAYTHAITTFLPEAEKKRQLDLADVAIARARASRDPGALAAASARKEEIEQSGMVATKADVEADALAKGERARARLDGASAKHAETLGREASAMDASARGALAAAAAYMQSSAAGAEAEVRQKAAHDAASKGISEEDQYRRQLAVTVATSIMDGAKAAAGLHDETDARNRVIAGIATGTVAYGSMNDALGDDAKLRPLLNAQMNATGDAAIRAADAIAALTTNMNDNHVAAERFAATQATHGTDNSIIGLHDQAEFAGDRSGAGQIEIARRAAERDAADQFPLLKEDDPKRTAFVDDKVSEARTKQTTDNALYAGQTLNSQKDAMAMSQAQLATLHMSADARALILGHLQQEQELTQRNTALDSDQAKEILAGADAVAKMNAQVEKQSAAWQEVQEAGGKIIDDLLNPKHNGLKAAFADAREELEKMALINPLKNMLLGQKLPSITDLFGGGGGGGFLSKLFSGGSGGIDVAGNISGADDAIASILAGLPHFASGTESTPSGLAEVGENGPELLNLPGGSRVTNAADTRRLLQASAPAASTAPYFDLRGAVMTTDLLRQMNAIGGHAATSGAMGGASLAQTRATKAQRRQLGTRR